MVFGHCRTMKALAGYLSSQWDIILIDEGSHFMPQMLRMLRTRLRTSLDGIRPQFIVGTNPGGEGHLYLKVRFITKNPPPDEERNYKPHLWAFIVSALEDNAYLDAEVYGEQFNGLSDAEFRAYRAGDWDAFAGQYFTEWNRALHTIDAADFKLEEWHEIAGGMDWGYSPSPGVIELARFDQFGRAVVYKELLFKECSATEVAQQLWARLEHARVPHGDPRRHADVDAAGRRRAASRSPRSSTTRSRGSPAWRDGARAHADPGEQGSHERVAPLSPVPQAPEVARRRRAAGALDPVRARRGHGARRTRISSRRCRCRCTTISSRAI
jgi:hypothetical protein